MTGPVPDLDALREKAEAAGRGFPPDDDEYVKACDPVTILAVLALVEEQRARISTLEEALTPFASLAEHAVERGEDGYGHWLHNTGSERISTWLGPTDFLRARDALAGSPAENKEQQ